MAWPTTWRLEGFASLLHLKYGVYDEDELKMKMDAIMQKPRQRVQLYYDRLERLFVKGKIPNAKRQRWFLAKLRP